MGYLVYNIEFDTETECGIDSLDIFKDLSYKAFNKYGEQLSGLSETDKEQVDRFIKALDYDKYGLNNNSDENSISRSTVTTCKVPLKQR